ncbi:VOC family protein [uncultured Kriegella sp.]|uniref:VOC family protein n=1 Tax=uncultured Kriegella sp. TaxID=1798910 RepID=UPI0030DAAF92|tara:strand:- start:16426 stop:16920 length:495 start_codon:yes stop_codon:yes gene_type:complete
MRDMGSEMYQKITPFLLFNGKAQSAMNFYLSIFPNSHISIVEYHHSKKDSDNKTDILRASFVLNGQEFMCGDSLEKHAFRFTQSFSLYIDMESVSELRRVFIALSENGKILMPIDNYGFGKCYAWVQDKFGVSWQLNVPNLEKASEDSNVCFANHKDVRPEYRE